MNLDDMSREQLEELARKHNILPEGQQAKGMDKNQLIQALKSRVSEFGEKITEKIPLGQKKPRSEQRPGSQP